MKQAVQLAPFRAAADPRVLAQMAREAEQAGWQGFFIWDHMNWLDFGPEIADPWVALAAVATSTSRIRLGTLVTPMPRRHPTKLARETVTLDLLSEGRLTLGVGLGAPDPQESEHLGLPSTFAERARMADEGLELLNLLWGGRPVRHNGSYYKVKSEGFQPTPVQQPRIPIWVAVAWPGRSQGPLKRAARYDGVVPMVIDDHRDHTPAEIAALLQQITPHRKLKSPLEVGVSGHSGQDFARDEELMQAFSEAGGTWWLEALDPWHDLKTLQTRIRRGPVGV